MVTKASPLHEGLLYNTIIAVAEKGLEGISLRAIATASGCSTAVIFQNFGNKAELIQASLDKALLEDKKFHEEFAVHVQGLTLNHQNFSELAASYIELRTSSNTAKFWSEILFKSRQVPNAGQALNNWHDMRKTFWQTMLNQSLGDKTLAPILSTYCCMEEVFAVTLNNHLEYRLLLRETIQAITAKNFDIRLSESSSDISEWIGSSSPRFQIPPQLNKSGVGQRLLDLAAKHIIDHGVGTLNQRKIAKQINSSPSMIAYHFGNVDSFVYEAIWQAITFNVPRELTQSTEEGRKQETLRDWAQACGNFISPPLPDSDKEGSHGFYISMARIAGQAALLSTRRQELTPFIDHIRNIEGSGSYRASKTIWPAEIKINRSIATAFGIWIKGQAILNEAIDSQLDNCEEILLATATAIFPSAP